MQLKFLRLFIVSAAVVALTVSAAAQEGHPLTGTWYGDFGPNATTRNDITVVMTWDGRVNTGFVNPGPKSVPLKSVRMDITPGKLVQGGQGGGNTQNDSIPPEFLVYFEVDMPNTAGGVDHIVFEGKIFNPVPANRFIKGTYTRGNERGEFFLRRT